MRFVFAALLLLGACTMQAPVPAPAPQPMPPPQPGFLSRGGEVPAPAGFTDWCQRQSPRDAACP